MQALIPATCGLDPSALDIHVPMRGSGVDSLAQVEFLVEVKHKYDICIPDNNPNLNTLAELALIVDQLRAAQTAAAQ